ncbi:hypothetical protein [Rhodobacter calidifons]|uniref:Uncharacterized protein n=1 Tax=Rhodobacter calidifons TaxID=2715277 RepID=A0ABX0G8R5_9RHOB|nr:hypothetical protein [Rhodobacter calidifons]NHB77511.1 hypothetical protein [Rhodobacter calidifons]
MIHDTRLRNSHADVRSDPDDFERGLLAVTRHFFADAPPDAVPGWRLAFGLATELWGISNGPRAAQSLLHLAEAVDAARGRALPVPSLSDGPMPHPAAGDEADLMALIHAIRRNRLNSAQIVACRMHGDPADPAILQATAMLAGLFPAEHPLPEGGAPAATPLRR